MAEHVHAPGSERASPPALLALEPRALESVITRLGGRPFHARIVRENVLKKGILDYARMTSLPAGLRALLALELPILVGREIERSVASDRTTKLLLGFQHAGRELALVETVHMPSLDFDSDPKQEPTSVPTTARGATLCVSTQVGCPVRCPFCASGKLGLLRNLESHEILEQYVRARELGPIARAVVMGIGEPLLNYENVARALEVVHDEIGLGSRKVTLSTVGFPERVRKIAASRPRFQLAISLHTSDQEQRDELVPAMRGVPIDDVLDAGDDWFEQTGREVTYEYVLLGGINDSTGHAQRLARRLERRRCTVNLIPFNAVRDSPYRRSDPADIARFQALLAERGIVATVRWSRGVESDAACGQLRIRRGTRAS